MKKSTFLFSTFCFIAVLLIEIEKMKINDDILIKYLTGDLAKTESVEVEKWIDASDDNLKQAEHLFFILKFGNQLNVMKKLNADEAYNRFQTKLKQRTKHIRLKKVIDWGQRIAAILFIPLLILTYYIGFSNKESFIEKKEKPMYVEVRSEVGMVSSFHLPDGTKVWLNSGSRLRYPIHFKEKQRQIEMEGQAYFEVTKNAHRPFLVKLTPDYEIQVLGTKFNVTAYANEDRIETTLVEGLVQLKLGSDVHSKIHRLVPNEKANYNKVERKISIEKIDPYLESCWKDGYLIFKDHPMSSVLKILSRRYHVSFDVKDKKVYTSVITGKFKDETLSQVLKYLQLASHIHYKINPVSITHENTLAIETVDIWR